jgi:hypothetical protein
LHQILKSPIRTDGFELRRNERPRTSQGVFLDRIRGHGPFRQSQRGGFVTETHIDEREIVNEIEIIRLFFEERFQFATWLLLAFTSHWPEQSG